MKKGNAVAIYTDGGLLTHNPSDVGGTWSYVAVDKNNSKLYASSGVVLASKLRIPRVTNNHTEHIALIKAMESLPEDWSGTVYSDSQVALVRVESDYELTHGVQRFPANEQNLPEIISKRSKTAAARLGKGVRFVLVQGHPTKADLECGYGKKRNLPVSEWNVLADQMCNDEKTKYRLLEKLDALVKEVGIDAVKAMVDGKIIKKTAVAVGG